MSFQSTIFNSQCINLGNGNNLHFINIPNLSDDIIGHIDATIVSICEGTASVDLTTVKQRLIAFLTPKKGSTTEMGAIAEFFGHLYLKEIGFKQEFLFLNLEEGSIKKGFDGYYSHNDLTWIYESKSGSVLTNDASHESKISLAYAGLKDKISGNPSNNPWQNAYNHACHKDVGTSASIQQSLKSMANEFTQGTRQNTASFNIIPGSTLFLEESWSDIDVEDLTPKLEKLMNTFSFHMIQIICVNKASNKLPTTLRSGY